MQNVEYVIPTQSENASLNALDNSYKKISEMTQEEREYLNALILRNKPKKLLEIGVSAGGSSIIMLNAIKKYEDSRLYSIDYSDYYYRLPIKKSGYFVNNYPNLKNKWELYTGGLALKFIQEIGNEIDFCLIDTKHDMPGEILDFLMVLPYLSENCIVTIHDVNLRTIEKSYDHYPPPHAQSSVNECGIWQEISSREPCFHKRKNLLSKYSISKNQ